MTEIWTRNHQCRACGSEDLELVLSLGETPLANRYLTAAQLEEPEPFVSLETYFCKQCTLMQLLHVVSPEVMFSHYLYVPSASETLRRHFGGLALELIEAGELDKGDLVVEIASNDGLLMKQMAALGLTTLGVEPATNIAEAASAEGQDVVNAFFNSQAAQKLRSEGRVAKAIVGTNVLAHVDSVRDFLAGVELLLDEEGTACFEVPHLLELLAKTEFDTIYHEHLDYFSLHALTRLFSSVGLTIFKVARPPIHGGSLRIFARRSGARSLPFDGSVDAVLAEEAEHGIKDLVTYHRFAERVKAVRTNLRDLLSALKGEGRRIAAYGAAAKGMTMLSYCGIGPETLDYVVDKSPYKQGHWTPGSHIPIYDVDKLVSDRPDYLLILAWNFSEEIIAQQQWFRDAGGKFIVPIPSPAVV